ncbi:MAG: DUF1549 domain-containing protein [Planctomycetaceae bacterium]
MADAHDSRQRPIPAPLFLLAVVVILADALVSSGAEPPAGSTTKQYDLAAWLDERYDQIWARNGIQPEFCDDATYCRRVSLDLMGRIPSVGEVRTFLEDPDPRKRERLVDRLLDDPDQSHLTSELHAEHMARLWRRTLVPPGTTGANMAALIEPWLKQQFRDNRPFDDLVRQLLTARGEDSVPEAIIFQALGGTPETEATEICRVFLGVRIGCAQCHDHPFADWKQRDFWGVAAYFSGTTARSTRQLASGGQTVPAGLSDDGATGQISMDGIAYPAKPLWTDEPITLADNQKPRDQLADWLTSADNPAFSANAVNRVWQLLLGRGLVPSVDDLDQATPAERALIVDDLGEQFAAAGFDLKWLIAGICKSKVYQCSAHLLPGDRVTFVYGRRPLKTLTPEQTFDSLEQALHLPVSSTSELAARHNGEMSQIVRRLDESLSTSPEEYSAGVPQVLLLMNGDLLANATDLDKSRTLRGVVESPFLGTNEKLDALYLAALTRLPQTAERAALLNHLQGQPDEKSRRIAYGDIFWALLNSPEFVLCR